MHLDDMICRLAAEELSPVDRRSAQAHLASCEACRNQLDAFRRLDSVLRAAPVPPLAVTVDDIRSGLLQRIRRERRGSVILLACVVVQAVAGALVLLLGLGRWPMEAGIIGGLLLGDTAFLAAAGLLLRERSRRLDDATREGQSMLREWRRMLEADRRNAGWSVAAACVLLANGILQVAIAVIRGPDPARTTLATMSLVLGILGLWHFPRLRRRSKGEIVTMQSMFEG